MRKSSCRSTAGGRISTPQNVACSASGSSSGSYLTTDGSTLASSGGVTVSPAEAGAASDGGTTARGEAGAPAGVAAIRYGSRMSRYLSRCAPAADSLAMSTGVLPFLSLIWAPFGYASMSTATAPGSAPFRTARWTGSLPVSSRQEAAWAKAPWRADRVDGGALKTDAAWSGRRRQWSLWLS